MSFVEEVPGELKLFYDAGWFQIPLLYQDEVKFLNFRGLLCL